MTRPAAPKKVAVALSRRSAFSDAGMASAVRVLVEETARLYQEDPSAQARRPFGPSQAATACP